MQHILIKGWTYHSSQIPILRRDITLPTLSLVVDLKKKNAIASSGRGNDTGDRKNVLEQWRKMKITTWGLLREHVKALTAGAFVPLFLIPLLSYLYFHFLPICTNLNICTIIL
ncbi:hypothetical protein E2542_SST25096 [Spatholobus suberectus]|nr:hypothetical protein E2542_SST25096 [Spatholobus suberectus]